MWFLKTAIRSALLMLLVVFVVGLAFALLQRL